MYPIDLFKDRTPEAIGKFRKSAVMLLVVREDGVEKLVLEKRAMTMRSQPGDICLPGGGIDPGETPKEASIREVTEELNIREEDIDYIGPMDFFISPYGQIMYPFVARSRVSDFTPNPLEVDTVLKVPLDFFLHTKPLQYDMDIKPEIGEDFPYDLIQNGRQYQFTRGVFTQYFYKYEGHVIWGFTARVVKSFIDILKEEKNEKL